MLTKLLYNTQDVNNRDGPTMLHEISESGYNHC